MLRKIVESYSSFSRTERMGIIGLLTLLFLLIGVRLTMFLWVKPEVNTIEEQRLTQTLTAYKQTVVADTPVVQSFADKLNDDGVLLPDTININTADSAILVRLKGIGPVTAQRILEYRKQYGAFKSYDEFKTAGHIRKPVFELLKPHLKLR